LFTVAFFMFCFNDKHQHKISVCVVKDFDLTKEGNEKIQGYSCNYFTGKDRAFIGPVFLWIRRNFR